VITQKKFSDLSVVKYFDGLINKFVSKNQFWILLALKNIYKKKLKPFHEYNRLNNQVTMSETINESHIIEKAIAGDPNSFAELVNLHQLFLYNLALRAVSNPQEAQDISQETFIRAWRSIKNFRLESSFRTWLYRILMNLCYDRYPRLRRENESLSIEQEEFDLPIPNRIDQYMDQEELSKFVHEQMQNLPEIYRLILSMRYQQDLSYQEIAEVMDMPIGTVKTTIYRAKAQLKERFLSHQEVSLWIA
jgi:RNA polymerase sigma-70 factor (ECF subfamily)